MSERNEILVVDDTKMFQNIYKAKLMSEGFRVVTAGNGQEALMLLSGGTIKLILLDLVMPLMDGFKVLHAVKSDPKLSSIIVIVLSSRGHPDEIVKAINLGADGYLIKSTVKPNEVLQKVKEMLKKEESG